jgi:hypothetical protein
MRQITPIAIALLAALSSFNASAADVSCTLLAREDLSGFGVNKDTVFITIETNWDDFPKVVANHCSVIIDTPAGKVSLLLSVDKFEGEVTEDQVRKWLKEFVDAKANQEGVTTLKIGETTCETGIYESPTSKEDGSPAKLNEFYIACDEQIGTRHISLNVQVPEASKSVLPTPEQAKSILDKSVQRLKEEN